MTQTGKRPANKNTPATAIKPAVVQAALTLAARQSWNDVTLAAIAAEAQTDLATLHEYFEDRTDILVAYGRQLDRKVLDTAATNATSSPRDQLFDLLMERFDLLNNDRDAVLSILASFRHDPKQAVIGLPHLGRSLSWMLEAAGIGTQGLKGALRVAGLTALYLKTLRVWCADESPDMAATMAALDKNLGQAEQWAATFKLNDI